MTRLALLLLFAVPICGYCAVIKTDISPWNYGSVSVFDESVEINIDVTESVRAIAVSANNFFGGVALRNDGRRDGALLRAGYRLALPLAENNLLAVGNENILALGLLSANYLEQGGSNSRFVHAQYLFGFGEYLKIRANVPFLRAMVKAGAEGTAAVLKDDYGSAKPETDNYGFGVSGFAQSKFSRWADFRLEMESRRKKYNPERYFFTEHWTTDFSAKSALVVSLPGLDLIPFLNYRKVDIERDSRPDLERWEAGGEFVMKDIAGRGLDVSIKGAYAPWRHRKGRESLVSASLNSREWGAELYQKDIREEFSSFARKESFTGLRVSWKFGLAGGDLQEGQEGLEGIEGLEEMDDYAGIFQRKYEFYRENGREDDSGLSLKQQAERLRTIRQRNEWSGANLRYQLAKGWSFREADEVYVKRSGDCDEQACLTSYMDKLNSHHSPLLAWWVYGGAFGHAVQLVQDRTNGQWFLDEYGILYKIKGVEPNASLEQIGLEALKQTHGFTALPISNGSGLFYSTIDCEPGSYEYLTWTSLINFQAEKQRPNIERGYELFIGQDMLFK